MKESHKPQASPEKFEYKEHKTLSSMKLMALSDRGPKIYTFDCSNQNQVE